VATDSFKHLAAAKARVAKLEATAAKERASRLAKLPAELGFASVDDLIDALRDVESSRRSRRKTTAQGQTGRRRRTKRAT